MHPARRLLIAILLLALGYFGVQLYRVAFPGAAAWDAQVRADALTAIAVLKPDAPDRLPPDFWDRWNRQMEPYDAERLADLRGRLELYLDFLEAEYSEAADIYTSAVDPSQPSEGVRRVRERLPAAFGPEADRMVENADELREQAYRMSPKHGGLDPDAPDFRVVAQDLRRWLTVARPRADALTAPPGERRERAGDEPDGAEGR